MKELPGSMDEALKKATQQDLVEAAQKRLQKEKFHAAEALTVHRHDDSSRSASANSTTVTRELSKQTEGIVEELAKQLQKLTDEVSQLRMSSRPTHQADQQK